MVSENRFRRAGLQPGRRDALARGLQPLKPCFLLIISFFCSRITAVTLVNTPIQALPCDGCGLPANPEHITARIRRLELATQFRPIHIGVLFVASSPPARMEDEFFAPPEAKAFFDSFLEALDIPLPSASPSATPKMRDRERLAEFQRRGHFLAYLSECPLPPGAPAATAAIDRLAPNLIRRIRFNYRPKHVALLGPELAPLVEVLRNAGIGPSLILHAGLPLPLPGTGAKDWKSLFQSAVASVSPSQNLPSGYDRIASNLEAQNPGAGGRT